MEDKSFVSPARGPLPSPPDLPPADEARNLAPGAGRDLFAGASRAPAVGAGLVPIALGSQTGGSVVRPAAFCGVAGYKPSFRLLPTVGMKCFSWSLDPAGLFAAGVADVAFAAAAITGRDLRIDQRAPAAPSLALVRTHLWHEASAGMQAGLERAARAAEAAGAPVRDLALPASF